MVRYLVIVSLWLFPLTTIAQAPPIQKLDGSLLLPDQADSIVNHLIKDAHVMGLAVAILNNDKPVYVKTFGLANNRTKRALDTSSILYGASFSKAIFACVVMQLALEKRLSLDTPLYRYLDQPIPAYPDYKDLEGDNRWKLITARMCLSHTTGFPNWRQLPADTIGFDPNGKLAIYFTPGTRYAYSGEGITLLQLVVEKVTGQTVADLAEKRIFRPLGLTRTSYTWNPAFADDCAVGHDSGGYTLYKDDGTMGKPVFPKPFAAGSLVSSIADYARLIAYVMRPSVWRDSLLAPEIAIHSTYQYPTITKDTTTENDPIHLSYGLGWGLFTGRYGKAFFKEGHANGWQNYNVNFPTRGTAIILMSNSDNAESIFRELLEKLIGDTDTPWKWERYVPYNTK